MAETPLTQEQCHKTRKAFLREFTKAVKVAFQSYTRQDRAARDRGEKFDGPVYVDCDSQISPWFTVEELGLVCQSARRGARVDAFQASGKSKHQGKSLSVIALPAFVIVKQRGT
jgi:hypothetical protein